MFQKHISVRPVEGVSLFQPSETVRQPLRSQMNAELLMYSLKRISVKADTIQQRSTASVLAFPHGGQADPHSITGLSYLGYSKEEHLAKILSFYCFSLHSF